MPTFIFNKLVRDNIPHIIRETGAVVEHEKLDKKTLLAELKKKLVEEATEVLSASSYEDMMIELADVQAVIEALLHKINKKPKDLTSIMLKKQETNGGFIDGYYIVKVRYHSNESTSQEYIDKLRSEPEKYIECSQDD